MKFGIVFKEEKKAKEFAQKATDYLKVKGHNVVLEKKLKDAKFIITFGGDGTLIHNACEFAEFGIPLVGINTGRLGFLTTAEAEDWQKILDKLISGEIIVAERMTIEAEAANSVLQTAIGNKKKAVSYRAVNEIVIKGHFRVVDLEIEVNGEKFLQVVGDGVIIATPTGSTAYSLSSGGPIVDPNLECFLVTPINPIGLPIPSVVVSPKDEIMVRIVKGEDISLVIDGQQNSKLKAGQSMKILRGKNIKLGYLDKEHFFKALNAKFNLATRIGK